MVTPPFRAGGIRHKASRLEDGTSGRDILLAGVIDCNISTVLKHRHSGGFRLPDGLAWHTRSPALKGGVTVKSAFQASHAFQASAVLLARDI